MKRFLLLCVLIAVVAGFAFSQEVPPVPVQPGQNLVPTQPLFPSQSAAPPVQTSPPLPPAQAPVRTTAQPEQAQPAPPPVPAQPAPAVQRRPGPDALQNYRVGRDLEARNRFEEANTYYNEAVKICIEELNRNNTNMDSYTVLAWSLLRQRRYADVINWGDRALRVNPGDYRIVETMGEAYFFLNDYEHALIMMQRYAASMPRGDRASTAYFYMGEIYRNQRKYLHADIAYTTAVTLEGSIFLWWLRLGTVREAAGEYTSAIQAYERAAALSPGNREAAEALERTRRLNTTAQR
ncbi:MAG: tetratricopeptide repeat protein [Treponema sp.]|nr:tetratricopeptide repeat protein [Treponema sp.]